MEDKKLKKSTEVNCINFLPASHIYFCEMCELECYKYVMGKALFCILKCSFENKEIPRLYLSSRVYGTIDEAFTEIKQRALLFSKKYPDTATSCDCVFTIFRNTGRGRAVRRKSIKFSAYSLEEVLTTIKAQMHKMDEKLFEWED